MGIKKSASILLAFLVLASNMGFAFSVHFCGDEVASVKPMFVSPEDSCCGKKASEPMGCCKTKIVKSDKEHDFVIKTVSFAFEAPLVPVNEFQLPLQNEDSFVEKPVASYYCEANAPPLFKLYNQFIFYA